ncbi:MAG: hypothetical protein EAX91_01900 [Candidatus Lokiarchaeota archaeon]|nr:hypothetical protein [Candidatus Lokiarchaeota archaeon]
MNDLPRKKSEILDLTFTILFTISMVLNVLFLRLNLIISTTSVIIFFLLSARVILYWIARNPFKTLLIRSFAYTNFLFSIVALITLTRPSFSDTPDYFPFGIVFLLFLPSGIYTLLAIFSHRSSSPLDKIAGAELAFYGKIKNIEIALFGDSLEVEKKRKEAITQLKTVYRYKLIVILSVLFPIISFIALIIGFL